jgi:4-amino-4-deoxychorismate lyase
MLVNGESVTHLSTADRGLQYGDGLFETIAIVAGSPSLWQQHIDRLEHGCKRLGIPFPGEKQLRKEALQEIGSAERAVLKIIVTRGEGSRGYRPPTKPQPTRMLEVSSWPEYPPENSRDGVAVRLCSTRVATNSNLAGLKHLNRLPQVMARHEWSDPEIAEGLMLDERDRVIAGTMSNLFLVKRDELWTPDLSQSGISGILRGVVLDVAQQQDITVQIKELTMNDVRESDALFLTNSLIGVWPIRELDGERVRTEPIDRSLLDAVRQRARLQ